MMIRARYRERQIAVATGALGGMHCFWDLVAQRTERPAWNSRRALRQEELITSQAKGPFPNAMPLGPVGRFLSSWQARERQQGYSLLRGIAQIILFGATEML